MAGDEAPRPDTPTLAALTPTLAHSAPEPAEPAPAPPGWDDSGHSVGRYLPHDEVGRGGLGRVREAWDRRLTRPVAIKEPLTPQARARFYREALLTARLEHPGIVPVYDAGTGDDGQPFYAMRLLGEGRSLSAALKAAASLDERLTLLPHVIAAADAVAYAHSRGIIHRDLKPDNILLGPFGETVVIDWGLAKDLNAIADPEGGDPLSGAHRVAGSPPDADAGSGSATPGSHLSATLTLAGTTVGTPAYMSPEQGKSGVVDQRTDVYALGAVLLELLAGKKSPLMVRQLELSLGDLDLGRHLPAGVPADLAAIVRQAMAIEPADRYPSARELAADLRRFAAGQLVAAHVYSPATLFRRWLARHRLPVAIAAGALALLAAGGVFSVRGIVEQRNRAEERNQALTLVQARTALDRDPTATLAWLRTFPADAPRQDLVRALVGDAAARGVARHVWRDFPNRVRALAFARGGTLLVVADFSSTLRLYDAASGARLGEWPRFGGTTHLRVFERRAPAEGEGPGGGLEVLTAGVDGRLLLTDLGSGAERAFAGQQGQITDLALFDGERRALTSARDGGVWLWELASGRGRELTRHDGNVAALALAPAGDAVYSAGVDATLRLTPFEPAAAKQVWTAPSPIGEMVLIPGPAARPVTADQDRNLLIWENGRPRRLYAHQGLVDSLAVSPDGRLLASAARDRTVRLLDLDELARRGAAEPRVFEGHTDDIEMVTFSPDGRLLVSSGLDGSVRLVDLATGRRRAFRGARLMVERVAFSPDGAWLASGAQDPEVRVWPLRGPPIEVLQGHGNDVDRVEFVDRDTLVSSGHDAAVRVWRRGREGWESQLLTGHQQAVDQLVLLPGGRVATAGYDHSVRVWTLSTGESRLLEGHGNQVMGLAAADQGRTLLSASLDGTLRIWPLEGGGEPRALAGHHGGVNHLALSPDGAFVATAGADHSVRLWDWRQGRELRRVASHADQVTQLAFSPDGSLLASGSAEGGVQLTTVATGELRHELRGHVDRIRSLAFSPDGRTLGTTSVDRTARLWDVATGESRVLRGHEASVRHLVFAPDGALVATSSTDRTTRLWDVASGELRQLYRYDAIVTGAAFSPDGRQLAVGGWDKNVHLHTLDPALFLPPGGAGNQRAIAALTTATTDQDGALATRP